MLSPGCQGIHGSCNFCSDEAKVEINEDVTLTGVAKAGHPALDPLQLAQGSGEGGDTDSLRKEVLLKLCWRTLSLPEKLRFQSCIIKSSEIVHETTKWIFCFREFCLWTHIHGDLFCFLLIFSIQSLFFKWMLNSTSLVSTVLFLFSDAASGNKNYVQFSLLIGAHYATCLLASVF